ncbi:MAG: hypothetical protein V1735_02430 [Nanoarchaeota archaeon]
MLTPEQKDETHKEITQLREEIGELKDKLDVINKEKEHWFLKKEEISVQIRDKITSIKAAKTQRNTLTKKVSDVKDLRKLLNDQIRDKIEGIKKLNTEKDEVQKKFNITKDPVMIQRDIDRLEFRIETEALSFEREQDSMKKIKELKSQLKESKAVSGVWDRVHSLSKEIDDLKRKATDEHRKIQNLAKESQVQHEIMLELSKDIDDIKAKEEEYYKKFFDLKQQFVELNNQLKEKMAKQKDLHNRLDADRAEDKEKRLVEEEKTLEQKNIEVEEKIKKGKKLTTEDLLIFQVTEAKQMEKEKYERKGRRKHDDEDRGKEKKEDGKKAA